MGERKEEQANFSVVTFPSIEGRHVSKSRLRHLKINQMQFQFCQYAGGGVFFVFLILIS